MFSTNKLTALRKSHYPLQYLPGTIFVLAADRLASSVRPIDKATLDEVAFAIIKAEQAYNAAGDRVFALRKLYNLAREAGGVGAACAVDAAAKAKGIR
ncbi:hypothetical protein IG197_11525 [Aminobacter sp. SR38]|jgi:hypothetical protein|uniref:hypothetical protein n=1 Tax=Aminobacter sp. SR38 TaxID=2774562 RepID=UPI00177FF299|nr:hypothetical protein [Aminobacter sp. SR38]QOF73631.1 hypothetical protein IG197_11525 [Aminobacter sp. SR38]